MASTIKLDAELRDEFGKGAARRIRRENKIPAVLYSNGETPTHVVLPGHETMLALRAANALLSIQFADGTEQLALPKAVQRNPIKDLILHVDLLKVERGEKVSVQVPLVLVGEIEDTSLLVNHERVELTVLAEATDIPASIEVSLDGLNLGDQILAKDVTLPEGVELDDDEEALIVAVQAPISEEQLEAELEVPGEDSAEPEQAAAEDSAE